MKFFPGLNLDFLLSFKMQLDLKLATQPMAEDVAQNSSRGCRRILSV
jgi:hypothetical protein